MDPMTGLPPGQNPNMNPGVGLPNPMMNQQQQQPSHMQSPGQMPPGIIEQIMKMLMTQGQGIPSMGGMPGMGGPMQAPGQPSQNMPGAAGLPIPTNPIQPVPPANSQKPEQAQQIVRPINGVPPDQVGRGNPPQGYQTWEEWLLDVPGNQQA